jgi:hypothetical protein
MGATGVTTVSQEAMWLEQVFAPAEPNNVVTLWDVDGDLDVPLFTSALQVAVAEADALWVNFRRSDDGLRLVAREPGVWEPFGLDVSDAADPAGVPAPPWPRCCANGSTSSGCWTSR